MDRASVYQAGSAPDRHAAGLLRLDEPSWASIARSSVSRAFSLSPLASYAFARW